MVLELDLPVEALARAYGFADSAQVTLLSHSHNEHFLIRAGRNVYALRRCRRSKSAEDLAWELALIGHVRSRGVAAPEVIPTLAGDRAIEVGGRLYCLTRFVEGTPYRRKNPRHLPVLATAQARYHQAARAFQFSSPAQSESSVPHHLRRRTRRLSNRSEAGLDRMLDQGLLALRQIESLPPLPHSFIQGGLRGGSTLFRGDTLAVVLDYDRARDEARVLDLAITLLDLAKRKTEPAQPYSAGLDLNVIRRYLDYYEQFEPLQPEERAALPAYMLAKRVAKGLARWERRVGRAPLKRRDERKLPMDCTRATWLESHFEEIAEAAHA